MSRSEIQIRYTERSTCVASLDGQHAQGASMVEALRALYRVTDHREIVARAGRDCKFFLRWLDDVQGPKGLQG